MSFRNLLLACLFAIVLTSVTEPGGAQPVLAAEGEAPGRVAFTALKCDVCHSVAPAGIEAKTKNDKLKGPELSAALAERERPPVEAFMRGQARLDGKKHKKEFKGTDEELQALLDWLFAMAESAPRAPAAGSA